MNRKICVPSCTARISTSTVRCRRNCRPCSSSQGERLDEAPHRIGCIAVENRRVGRHDPINLQAADGRPVRRNDDGGASNRDGGCNDGKDLVQRRGRSACCMAAGKGTGARFDRSFGLDRVSRGRVAARLQRLFGDRIALAFRSPSKLLRLFDEQPQKLDCIKLLRWRREALWPEHAQQLLRAAEPNRVRT